MNNLEQSRQRERAKYIQLYNNGISKVYKIPGSNWKEYIKKLKRNEINFVEKDDCIILEHPKQYGIGYSAKNIVRFIISRKKIKVKSFLDIGCGRNSFVNEMRSHNIKCWGLDFASPQADIVASAHNIPLADNSIDWVTAFDIMEHLLPEEINQVLTEFRRIATKGIIFSICYRQSYTTVDDEHLHQTIRDEQWWIEQLSQYIRLKKKFKQYLWGYVHGS